MAGKWWTKKEISELLTWWGSESRAETAIRVGRTIGSCTHKVHQILGSGAARSRDPTWNLAAVIKKSGYSQWTVVRALEASGATYQRAGPTYRIPEDQVEKVMAHLREHFTRWAQDWDCCQRCGTDDQTGMQGHRGNGYCSTCHAFLWNRTHRFTGRGHNWRKGILGQHPTSSEPATADLGLAARNGSES